MGLEVLPEYPVREGSRFELEARYVVSERAERILEEYGLDGNSVRKAFERSLKFLSLLGGVGARSRRRAGSLMWEEVVLGDGLREHVK